MWTYLFIMMFTYFTLILFLFSIKLGKFYPISLFFKNFIRPNCQYDRFSHIFFKCLQCIMIWHSDLPTGNIDAHTGRCILRRTPDPSDGYQLKWSLSYEAICFCQQVLLPKYHKANIEQELTCIGNSGNHENRWYTTNPTPLADPVNWTPEILDTLLNRETICCKLRFLFLI